MPAGSSRRRRFAGCACEPARFRAPDLLGSRGIFPTVPEENAMARRHRTPLSALALVSLALPLLALPGHASAAPPVNSCGEEGFDPAVEPPDPGAPQLPRVDIPPVVKIPLPYPRSCRSRFPDRSPTSPACRRNPYPPIRVPTRARFRASRRTLPIPSRAARAARVGPQARAAPQARADPRASCLASNWIRSRRRSRSPCPARRVHPSHRPRLGRIRRSSRARSPPARPRPSSATSN